MSRRKKAENSQSEPIDDSTMVFAGFVRAPGEDKGLSVDISKSGGDIVMTTDKAELGRWPVADVTIRPLDATLFAFDAEGDHLLFAPTDPVRFGVSPLVTVAAAESGRRRRRKRKRRSAATEPIPVVNEELTRKEPGAATTNSQPESVEPESVEPESVEPESVEPESVEPESVEPESVEPESAGSAEASTAFQTSESREEPPTAQTESAVSLAEPSDAHEEPSKGFKPKRWLWLLDVGRRNRFFGLDRVPVDESLRGVEHQHSWDHRVATHSGLAGRVCTICGRIRVRKA